MYFLGWVIGAIIELPLVTNWFILIAWSLTLIGMYYFIYFSRLVFLFLTITLTILSIVSGLSVVTEIDFFCLMLVIF